MNPFEIHLWLVSVCGTTRLLGILNFTVLHTRLYIWKKRGGKTRDFFRAQSWWWWPSMLQLQRLSVMNSGQCQQIDANADPLRTIAVPPCRKPARQPAWPVMAPTKTTQIAQATQVTVAVFDGSPDLEAGLVQKPAPAVTADSVGRRAPAEGQDHEKKRGCKAKAEDQQAEGPNASFEFLEVLSKYKRPKSL